MKLPLSWLRDYVDLTLTVPQLVERLTLAGLPVDAVDLIGVRVPEGLRFRTEANRPIWDRDKIVIAQVLEVARHPNADKLKVVTVDYGAGTPKVLVTGAENVRVGDQGYKIILALPGAILFDGHAKEKVLAKPLKQANLRGVPSDSMVCSAKELGWDDEDTHHGIIILEDEAPVGKPLMDYMGDVVLELDVLPNMARCLSVIGVAREVAALSGQTLKLPAHAVQAQGEPIAGRVHIRIEDPALCARYTAMLIRDVKHGDAPQWMQRRLHLAGMRPIDNVVDVTNYVMLEWGQPLHAFDYDKLVARAGGQAPTIIVRSAQAGEVLKTLDGVERKLGPENLLIADIAGPIALAGVMGGADTEVSKETKNVLLESASFHFVSIRKTARAFDLPSEASYRFSRGVHPELVKPAAERAAELLRQYAGGTVCQGLAEQYPAPVPPQTVTLEMAEVRRLLGVEIPRAEAARILRTLEFQVEEAGPAALRVTTPPHRLDVQEGQADLIEELARVYGYDRLPATMLADRLPKQRTNRGVELEERARDLLVNLGLQEVMTYSMTTPEHEAPLAGAGAAYVRLANPISSERTVMRRSVLAGVLEAGRKNLENFPGVRLFEVGHVYLPRDGQPLPDEPRRLALFLAGPRQPESWQGGAGEQADFYDLKGVVEGLLTGLHLPAITFQPAQTPWLHPGKSAEVLTGKQSLGSFGQLHPGLTEAFGLGRRAVLVGELDLEAILAAVPERYAYRPFSEYPPVKQDIAIVVDEATTNARVEAEITAGGGDLLRSVRLFDVYRGGNVPAGKKSLAYALTYQAPDKTLTDKEVAKVHGKIVARLEKVVGAQLRA